MAVAFAENDDITYVIAEHEDKQIIVARERVEKVLGPEAAVVRDISKEELATLTYEPLFSEIAPALGVATDGLWRLVPAPHVTAEDGSGLVHMAPAFGEEDALVGKEHNLPTLRTIDTNGVFLPDIPEWGSLNLFEANEPITANLQERGLLLKKEQYTHSYPYCWRCDEPLIYYALDTWFVRIVDMKDELLANNEQVTWIPEHLKKGRFAKGIESAPDWAVSRSRFWSVPMPIWECSECEERTCIGSRAELEEKSGTADIADLHRPYVDDITWDCSSCSGTMRRVEDVLDVWFDSGSMPYAQWHYPFDNKEFVEAGFPADFIAEAIEMTRAWFYVLHVLATGLTRRDLGLGTSKPAYRNVIGSGLIFAEDGKKLSKKLKNYPEPAPTIAEYGADTLRLYLLSSASLGEPYRFSEKDLKQLHRNAYGTLWNVYSFFTRYAAVHDWQPGSAPDSLTALDEWILARTRSMQRDVIHSTDRYQIDQAARIFIPYIDDLSNWYVRRSRSRFQPAGDTAEADAKAALHTLYTVLLETCRIIAPFMPFVAESMYRNLSGKSSVHLERLPSVAEAAQAVSEEDEARITTMRAVRDVVREGLALRAKARLKVRQPLAELVIDDSVGDLSAELRQAIQDELNVKSISVDSLPHDRDTYEVSAEDKAPAVAVALNTVLTPELEREGAAREIIRHGQQLRRQAGFELADRIVVSLTGADSFTEAVLEQERAAIMTALQADEIVSDAAMDASAEVKIGESTIQLGVAKV